MYGRYRFFFPDDPHGLFNQMPGYFQMHADRLAIPALLDKEGISSGCSENTENFTIFLSHTQPPLLIGLPIRLETVQS
jgi:hypothetical protein